MKRFAPVLVIILAVLLSLVPVRAQEEEARSRLIEFVENQLSAPNRQIRLNGIQGTLSSNVTLQSITISDDDGVWLTIVEPQLVWQRTALLRGRLEIERLAATRIEMPRGPLPSQDAPPSAEASGGFGLPELPVAINLEELDVPQIVFGQSVFGLASELSVKGDIALADGSLATNLDITRLDGPGGNLTLDLGFDRPNETLDLSAIIFEPENGLIANMLGLAGKPPVSLIIDGDGPLSALVVDASLDVDDARILEGEVTLDDTDRGRRIGANLGGPLSTILPPDYAALLGDDSRLSANALLAGDGAIEIDSVSLDSGAIRLQGNGNLLADGFLSALNLNAQILSPSGDKIAVPGDGFARFQEALFEIAYDAEQDDAFSQVLAVREIDTAALSIGRIDLQTRGTMQNINTSDSRALAFTSRGSIQGIDAEDEALGEALGTLINIEGEGQWRTGLPLEVSAFDIVGKDYSLRTNGAIEGLKFDGQIGIEAADLTSFSAITGQDLNGSLGLVATGLIEPLSGAFDLDVRGVGNALQTGTQIVDALLEGATNISGGLARNEDGLNFERLRVTNNQADIVVDGSYASTSADLTARFDLRDLADISDQGQGAAALVVTLEGTEQPYDANISLALPRVQLAGKAAENIALGFSGTVSDQMITGALSGSGLIDGQAIELGGQISRNETQLALDSVLARIGAADLSIDLTRSNDSGLMDGTIDVDARNIDAIAALALLDGSGAVRADIALTSTNNTQSATVDASARNLVIGENAVGAAEIKAQIAALLSEPQVEATIEASDISASGTSIRTLSGDVTTRGDDIGFDLAAQLAQENTRITTRGTFTQMPATQRVVVDDLSLRSNLGDVSLIAPTQIDLADGTTTIADTSLNVAGGTARISGSVGERLALSANLSQLPLSIANAVSSGLGLGGVISADIDVAGTPSAPAASFTLRGSGVTAAPVQQNGIAPLTLSATGRYGENGTINLSSLSISNAQDIQVSGSGAIPLSGSGLNFAAEGSAPLTLAQRFVASRGARVSGLARFNLNARGAITNPQLDGLLSVSGGSLTDPLSNLQLNDIGLIAGLNGETISIQRLSAQLASGGSISGSGSVGISGDMPADLSLTLQNARYTDGQTFHVTAGGQLAVTGSLARNPLLSGQINLTETQITVPENFASGSNLLDVRHQDPDFKTEETLERLALATPTDNGGNNPSIVQLDLQVNAPNRIFVRGRGLDAELGGQVILRGPITNVRPLGQFDLRRGRLSVIGQRFDLDEGSVTLTGNLDPLLLFVARTQSGDVTAFITLEGRVNDLDVSFTSAPELPEDEVLAIIIFGKNIAELSATQVARLASIASELTGGNSPGLVDGLRSGLGLDDLDIVQDTDGNAAVRAGKYIADNVYLGVETGRETEATINLDITDSLTARGTVGTDGDTSLGVFFERDY